MLALSYLGIQYKIGMGEIKAPEPKAKKNQVCVWPGTTLGEMTSKDFEDFMLKEFEVKVKFLEIIKTSPDLKNGSPVEGTGGRSDLFFEVLEGMTGSFCLSRLHSGIRWIEDVLDNEEGFSVYPERVKEYRTW